MISVFLFRFLENEIHKTNLKLMEGETIKKKYSSILDMLKKERLTFTNQLEVVRPDHQPLLVFDLFYWPSWLHCLYQAIPGHHTNKIYPFKALETTIKKQDDEIERLKNTQKVIKIS